MHEYTNQEAILGDVFLQKAAKCINSSDGTFNRISKREASSGYAWGCFIPIGCSLAQYYNNESAYNTVWNLKRRMEKIETLYETVNTYRNDTTIALNQTLKLQHEVETRLNYIEDTLPAYTWQAIQQGIEINNQNIFLQDIALGITRGRIGLKALFKLIGHSYFHSFDEEDTLISKIECENGVSVAFTLPIADETSYIGNAFGFKLWSSKEEYLHYVGPNLLSSTQQTIAQNLLMNLQQKAYSSVV